jgi:hypothetical protein
MEIPTHNHTMLYVPYNKVSQEFMKYYNNNNTTNTLVASTYVCQLN